MEEEGNEFGLPVKGPSDKFKFVTGTELVIDGGWLDFLINLSFAHDKKIYIRPSFIAPFELKQTLKLKFPTLS